MFGYDKLQKETSVRKADIVGIACVVLAAAFSALAMFGMRSDGEAGWVVAEQDGKEVCRLSLREAPGTSVRIDCDGGYNILTVSDGSVRITEADCPDQICVRQGSIVSMEESIICLPHRLVVRLEGVRGDGS